MGVPYNGREDEHDLGDGHSFVWLLDQADNVIGLIEHHPAAPGGPPGARYCGGYVAWVAADAQQGASPGFTARHQLVSGGPGDEEHLTIYPSLACRHCPSHGFIRDGRWVSA